MSWPTPQDYSEAVQHPAGAFYDDELRTGHVETNPLGLPRPRSGAFAVVYKLLCASRSWAVRCFSFPVSDQQERYAAIGTYLAGVHQAYLVQFGFLTRGIRIGGQPYPILKMEWVEGDPLVQYVQRCLGEPSKLADLAVKWLNMTRALHSAGIAHGDLQHGNVLVVNGDLRLVDYDGMYVPGLSGKASAEVGHRNYQHPLRTEFDFGPELDNFSTWCVYLSLIALSVDPQLWNRFHGGDECLLFRQTDFTRPDASQLFRALASVPDDRVRSCARLFRSLLDLRPRDIPGLDATGVPAPLPSSVAQPGASWIRDHIPSETTVTVSASTPLGALAPGWIYDSVSGPVAQIRFEGKFGQERVGLLASVLALILLGCAAYLSWVPLGLVALCALALACVNLLVWRHRFGLEPSLVARREVDIELQSAAAKVVEARALVASIETKRKAITVQYSIDMDSLVRAFDALKSEEAKATDGVRSVFQAQKTSLDRRRAEINGQENSDLQQISSTLGVQLRNVTAGLSGLDLAESREVASRLTACQNKFVTEYLRRFHVEAGSVTGIGPAFAERLRMMGVSSAADVDGRIYRIRGIGSARASAIEAWRDAIKLSAQQKMPKSLTVAELESIRGKYASQRPSLFAQKLDLERQLKTAESAVREKFSALRATIVSQEASATSSAQGSMATVQSRFRGLYRDSELAQKKRKDEFHSSIGQIEQNSAEQGKLVFKLAWEQEKIQRRRSAFSAITFGNYVKQVFYARGG